jgi:hypothetical protein
MIINVDQNFILNMTFEKPSKLFITNPAESKIREGAIFIMTTDE